MGSCWACWTWTVPARRASMKPTGRGWKNLRLSCWRRRLKTPGGSQLLPRQPFVGFQILRARLGDHFARQRGAGRILVPVEGLEVIADELLVEAGLALAGFIFAGGPEARGIGRQHLVDQDELALEETKFKLRVRYDDAALAGVIAAGLVDLQAQVARLRGDGVTDDLLRALERDVLVVAFLGLGGRREDRFGQLGGFRQSGGQLDAADRLRLLVFLPARAAEITAHDAFDGERLGLLH